MHQAWKQALEWITALSGAEQVVVVWEDEVVRVSAREGRDPLVQTLTKSAARYYRTPGE